MTRRQKWQALSLAAMLLIFASMASAQAVLAPTISTTVSYSVGESLTLSVDTTSLVLTQSQQAVHLTASWALASGRSSVMTMATFNSQTALSGLSGNTIPSSEVWGQGIGSEGPCNGAPPGGSYFAENGYLTSCGTIQQIAISGSNLTGTNTAPFEIRIAPGYSAPPDQYSGILLFVGAAM